VTGVLSGFGVILAVVALGWLLARTGVLGPGADLALNRLVFFVATPALLFDSLSRTTPGEVFDGVFVVCASTALALVVVYLVVARLGLRPRPDDLVVGALATGYVNSANLGIPIALYVLGDLGFVTPLLLCQVAVLQLLAIAAPERSRVARGASGDDDSATSGGGAVRAALVQALRTPLVLSALLGVLVAALPWTPSEKLLEPVHLVGQISVPGALLVFGMSLYGVRVLEKGVSPRREIALATTLKVVVHPLLAWALGAGVLGMRGHELLTVVVAATLPTAQNVLVVAKRYGAGELIARDTALLSTIGAVPVMLGVTALLAG